MCGESSSSSCHLISGWSKADLSLGSVGAGNWFAMPRHAYRPVAIRLLHFGEPLIRYLKCMAAWMSHGFVCEALHCKCHAGFQAMTYRYKKHHSLPSTLACAGWRKAFFDSATHLNKLKLNGSRAFDGFWDILHVQFYRQEHMQTPGQFTVGPVSILYHLVPILQRLFRLLQLCQGMACKSFNYWPRRS